MNPYCICKCGAKIEFTGPGYFPCPSCKRKYAMTVRS